MIYCFQWHHSFAMDFVGVTSPGNSGTAPILMIIAMEVLKNKVVSFWVSPSFFRALKLEARSGEELNESDRDFILNLDADENDALISFAFQRLINLVRQHDTDGKLTPHYHDYSKIQTIG